MSADRKRPLPQGQAAAANTAVRTPPATPNRPRAVQPKTPAATPSARQTGRTPTAPLVYRPQPTPRVLQPKSADAARPAANAPRRPVAPPVYRPAAKKTVQPKMAAQARQAPKAPPVYRPEAKKIVQPKTAVAGPARPATKAPTASRPASKNVAQSSTAANAKARNVPAKGQQAAPTRRLFVGGASMSRKPVVQRILEPFITSARFIEVNGAKGASKGIRAALDDLHEAAHKSVHKFSPDELSEELRKLGGLSASKINSLTANLDKAKSSDKDEEHSGEKGHTLTRHLTISDSALEARLRGPNAIATASRFANLDHSGRSVVKFYNKLKSELPPVLKKLMNKYCTEVRDVMTNVKYGYATLGGGNVAKRQLIQSEVGQQTVVETDDYTLTVDWRYLVNGAAGGEVKVRAEYAVVSVEEFEKEKWSLNASDKVVKREESEAATMYSGSNTPEVTVLSTDTEQAVLAKVPKSGVDKIGVTLF